MTGQATVDREAIRAELERTRAEFHALLGEVAGSLTARSANPAWSVGAVMNHIATAVGFSVQGVDMARRGKNFNPPALIVDPLNRVLTWWAGRTATASTIAATYDEGHRRLLAALDGVRPDEWQLGHRLFGQYDTVASIFHHVRTHFDEHAAEVRDRA
jgi:hypothetical protein